MLPKEKHLRIGHTLTAMDALAMVERQESYTANLKTQYEKASKCSAYAGPDDTQCYDLCGAQRHYLGRISSRTGASVGDVRKWNKLKGNTIYPGQKLTGCLKAKVQPEGSGGAEEGEKRCTKSADGSFLTYEVKPGDTLWSITRSFRWRG